MHNEIELSHIILITKNKIELKFTIQEARSLYEQLAQLFEKERVPPIIIERHTPPYTIPYQPLWVTKTQSDGSVILCYNG